MANEILRRINSIKAVSLPGWRKGFVGVDGSERLLDEGMLGLTLLMNRQGNRVEVAKRIE